MAEVTELTFKKGDTLPILTFTLSDEVGPVNLTSATEIELHMKSGGTSVTGVCVKDADQGTNPGKGTYTWTAPDVTVAGTYDVEFQVTRAGGITTYPNDGNLTIIIIPDLAD